MPLFLNFSKAIQTFFYNKVSVPSKQLAPSIHLYLKAFSKFFRDREMANEGIKTLWLIVERAGLKESDLPDLVHDLEGERLVMCEEMIDFLIERIETLVQP